MQSRRLTECCASVVLARQCIARVVVVLKIVASSWCFHLLIYDARNHETETETDTHTHTHVVDNMYTEF